MVCVIWLRAEGLGIMDTKVSNTELCLKVQGSTFGVTGLEFTGKRSLIWTLGFMVQDWSFRIQLF